MKLMAESVKKKETITFVEVVCSHSYLLRLTRREEKYLEPNCHLE